MNISVKSNMEFMCLQSTFNIATIWLHQYPQLVLLSYYVSINAS